MSTAASEVWQLSDTSARLTLDNLVAEVSVDSPGDGILPLSFAEDSLSDVHLLRWQPDESDPRPLVFVDSYIRGRDLVSAYAAVPPGQVQPQIYWRAVHDQSLSAAGIQLIVSVQTSLLDSRPQSMATSEIGVGEIWQLLDPIEGSFTYLALDGPGLVFDDPSTIAPSLLVIRPLDAKYSYAEMIHPTDFFSLAIKQDEANPARLRITSKLFPQRLEKGVIRRGRVCAWFLPREGDLQTAAELYRRFISEPPPLTT